MKRFFTLALYCLWLVGLYAQVPTETEQKEAVANGIYLFEKAELFIRNAQTKEVIEHKLITDAAQIDPYDMHLENTFWQVEMRDGYLNEFVLPDGQKYTIEGGMTLQAVEDDKKEFETKFNLETESNDKHIYVGRSLLSHNIQLEGDRLIISYTQYPFGQSDLSFTLEAELILTMTKQEDDETNNI